MDSGGSAESSGARGQTAETKADAVALRKLAAHPPTAVMVKEALTALDSRKGASSQAIQSYIKQSYPSVDVVRLKHLVRNALKKGMDNGTLVRPANATVTTGAQGKFKLAAKVKEPKPKGENADPNEQKAVKAPKATTKTKNPGATAKTSANAEKKAPKELKPPKKPKKDENVPPKAAAAKKPKAKKADAKEPEEGSSSDKTEVVKPTKKTKVSQKVAEADGGAPASRGTRKRGKKD